MATLREIREQYPQYSDLSNRELLDGIRNKYYPDMEQQEFYSKALGSPDMPDLPTQGEIWGDTIKGGLRQGARMIPLVGGFADDIEAGVRAIGSSTREEELAKIRQENEEYQEQLDRAGVKDVATVGELLGSIGAGAGVLGTAGKLIGGTSPKLAKTANTLKGQMGIGTGIGAVEGAGYADEEAGTGAVIGALTGGIAPTVLQGVGKTLQKPIQKVQKIIPSTKKAIEYKKIAGKPISEVASDNVGTQKLIKGIDASPKLADELQDLSQEAIESTSQRVNNTVKKSLGLKSIEDIAKPAKNEYQSFMKSNASTKIPVSKVLPLYRKANVNRLAKQLRADNPDTLGKMPLNSVGFLQELKSTASARGRTGSENASEWAKVGRTVKGAIDENFSGFKELNKKFAKAIQAEELAETLVNPKGQETSNIAKSLLSNKNIRDLKSNFGEEKASKVITALRKERDLSDNLKSIATKSRNRAQDRGSLNAISRNIGDVALRGAGVYGLGTINPLLAVGAGGAIGAREIGKRLATKGARELLQGGTKANTNPLLQALGSQQASKLTGGQE